MGSPAVAVYAPPGRRIVRVLLLLLGSILSLPAGDAVPARLPDLKMHRTVSRRFIAVGREALDNMEAGRWAEEAAVRVEALIGIPLPFASREIRIVIRPPSLPRGDANRDTCRLLGLTQQLDESGRLVQRLVIPAAACLAEEAARAAFCRLLLEGFFPLSRPSLQRPTPPPVAVPRWLPVGLARNLTREEREDDARRLLAAWQRGEVTPLLGWLGRETTAPPGALDGPIAGVLVSWLIEAPDGPQRLSDLFSRLDRGQPVTTGWLVAQRSGGTGAADVESAWDAWIMRQQRKVFRPGTTPPKAVTALAAELLLYPGGFGIPLASAISGGEGFGALIALREADWIATFCRAKRAALQLHAVGRGLAFHAVVDHYVLFLDSLAAGKQATRLSELLSVAEAAMRELVLVRGEDAPKRMGEIDDGNTGTQDPGR